MAGKLTSLLQWLNTVFARGATQVLVETDDSPTVTLPKPTPVIVVGTVNSGGTLTGNSATGTMPVTEASAAAISSNLTKDLYANAAALTRFGAISVADADLLVMQRRIFSVDLTSDGAGAIAATTIVPALAGYTGHAQLIGIYAAATDAATTWTIACTGGTLLGPGQHVMAHTANCVTQFGATAAGQTGCPVYVRGTLAADDNKPLTVSAAGYAATQTATIFGYYWYET